MSVVQTDLHKYFKVKKNSKVQDLSGKANKSQAEKNLIKSEVKVEGFVKKDSSQLNYKNSSDNCEKISDVKHNLDKDLKLNDISCLTKVDEVLLDKPVPLQGIYLAERETCLENASKNNDEKQTTPNIKYEETEGLSRKRKRQEVEDEYNFKSFNTPEEKIQLETSSKAIKRDETSVPTAKKKLNLDLDDQPALLKAKLKPEDIKKQLGKCGRLDELRSRLLKLNQCEEKINAFRSQAFKTNRQNTSISPSKSSVSWQRNQAKKCSPFSSPQKNAAKSPFKVPTPSKDKRRIHSPKIKSFDSFDIEVPVSPYKSPAKVCTPVKSCYERFSHLAEPSSSGQLQLPHRYQVVKEVFRAVDTVVSLLHNRQELITYSKLKPAVQEMLRKTFSESHLGQLKAVFPLAYFFSQEKIKKKGSFNSFNYQLTMKPNMNYKKDKFAARNLMQELDSTEMESIKYRKMDSVVLVERRHIFHNALLDILKKHHTKFLQTLDPPIILEGPIQRWHPEFPLEVVDPPTPSLLPQPPSEDIPETAKGVLDKAKDIFAVNNRMKEAIHSVAATPVSSKPTNKTLSTADNNNVAAALKGISLSLLEKIRAREAAKTAREMTRSTGASHELEMLSRLPELVRVLRSMFVTEKKAALPWESVTAKIVASHSGSLSTSEAESHLNLLMKEVSGWCTIHKVRTGTYIKVDKSQQLQGIIDKLHAIIKEKT